MNKGDADATDYDKAYRFVMEWRKRVSFRLRVLRNTVLIILLSELYRYLVKGTQNYLFHHNLLDHAVAACILFGFASFWEFIHQRRQLDAVLVLLSKLLEDQKGQSLRFPLIFRS